MFGGSNKGYKFEIFSVSHLCVIGLFILGTIFLYVFREYLRKRHMRRTEMGVALSLILAESVYHVWMISNGMWNVSHALPLELCSISLILTIILLFSQNRFVYEVLFFTGLLGASQALLTPLLYFDFPHVRFLHFFYTHMMIIWVPLYFTWVYGYRPTIFSCLKLLVTLNVLIPFIILVNKLTEGNYMFLSHKPETDSLLDFLGPYPWYIFSLEGLLISLSLILWLLFRERPAKKHVRAEKEISQ